MSTNDVTLRQQDYLGFYTQIRELTGTCIHRNRPEPLHTANFKCSIFVSMELLTALAILPFLAALVVGAREADDERP